MAKLNTKAFVDVEFEDRKLVESIERVMTAAELLEARGRILTRVRAELDEARAETKRLTDEYEQLKATHKNLIDRIEDLVWDKGDES